MLGGFKFFPVSSEQITMLEEENIFGSMAGILQRFFDCSAQADGEYP